MEDFGRHYDLLERRSSETNPAITDLIGMSAWVIYSLYEKHFRLSSPALQRWCIGVARIFVWVGKRGVGGGRVIFVQLLRQLSCKMHIFFHEKVKNSEIGGPAPLLAPDATPPRRGALP